MLTPYERKGKVIKGLYKINWEAVRYVASLIPMNPGEARLSRLNKASEKLSFGPFRVALEVIREFNALWGGTSLFASLFWAGAEGITHGRKPCNTRTPCVTPPSTHHLRRTLLKVGPHLLPAYVLGSRAEVYLVTAGVGGGAKSTFACLVYPDGKRLCGTPKLIQELLNSTGGVVPYPTPYGGYGLRPVVDYPPRGLLDFSTAPDHAKRYEPGLQLYGTSLLSCLSRFHVEVTTYKDLPEGFRGQASLVFKPSEAYASELSAHPDSLVPDVLHCLDALRGARDLLMHSLDTLAPDATLPRALELARLLPPPKYAEDPPLDIYVLYTPRNREGSRWRKGERHVATLDRFISELRDRLTQKAVLHGGKEVRQVKARDIEVIIPLPDTPQLRQLLALGYIYIYSNPRKDPEGAARFEFRPYSGVTDNYDKRALLSALVGVVALLGQPLEEARRALSQ
jgi:hypothetical protein